MPATLLVFAGLGAPSKALTLFWAVLIPLGLSIPQKAHKRPSDAHKALRLYFLHL